MEDVKGLLEQAISALYVDLAIQDYSFDTEEEIYTIDLIHKPKNKKIHIGFRDSGKRRDFDVIPLNTVNAPLGLIEICLTFLRVYWDAQQKNQTILESLAEMLEEEVQDVNLTTKEEKLVQ